MDHILFIHSSIDGHQGCFHLQASVNHAAMNVDVQTSVQGHSFISFLYIPRSAGSYYLSFTEKRVCQPWFIWQSIQDCENITQFVYIYAYDYMNEKQTIQTFWKLNMYFISHYHLVIFFIFSICLFAYFLSPYPRNKF